MQFSFTIYGMYERRSIFRDPKKQILLAVLLAVVVFIFLLGWQGVASQVFISDGHAYLAVGRFGGVRILDIQDPINPVELGYYNTPGTAHRVWVVGNHLYVADGRSGLRILEVSDPGMPVVIGVLTVQGADIQDVAVSGSYAYLAMGEAGLGVADVSNPTRPLLVGSVNTPGFAQRVAMVHPEASLFQRPDYVYVADGSAGLHVADVQLPFSPRLLVTFAAPGETQDVMVTGPFALVASGRGGVWLLNITNPTAPEEYSAIEYLDDARAITVVGSDVFVADGEKGVHQVDFSNPTRPAVLSTYQTPGVARDVLVNGNFIYIADDNQGLRVLDRASPFDPNRIGLYETPGEASVRQVLSAAVSIATGRMGDVPGKVWRTMGIIAFDLVLFFIVLAFWLFVFAQFVMPVTTLNERAQVTERIFAYHTGSHGPAIFIENGKIRQGAHEKNRRGPGVALLDTASAAVLRNAHAFTRSVGPGVVFTAGSEYFESAVDLHRQVVSIGLREETDPFAPKGSDESLEEYHDRQKQRYLTSALTRDGVEVVPVVATVFHLISEPGQGKTLYGYNPISVWKAIAREGVNPEAPIDSDRRHVPWNWLPVYIAVDLWREYLRKFTLNELFAFTTKSNGGSESGPRRTAFDTISDMIQARMTMPEVEDLDDSGRPTGIIRPSLEYSILKDRGIHVLGASVRSLRFPQVVEAKLLEQWKGTWLMRAHQERKEVETQHSNERVEGQDLALKEFSSTVSLALYNRLQQHPEPSLAESLKELVEGTLKLSLRDSELQPRLTNQKAGLVELIDWIGKQ
jgi:hypothetical protein